MVVKECEEEDEIHFRLGKLGIGGFLYCLLFLFPFYRWFSILLCTSKEGFEGKKWVGWGAIVGVLWVGKHGTGDVKQPEETGKGGGGKKREKERKGKHGIGNID